MKGTQKRNTINQTRKQWVNIWRAIDRVQVLICRVCIQVLRKRVCGKENQMKIVTVVGARPQFIKAAVGSRQLRKEHREVLVHTGQHYDANMSDVFFEEMDIPKPDYNLGIAGGGHGEMTGRMLIELEKVFQKENPDAVLVYGDTNSTMAAALAAVKLHIPVVHCESGNRFNTLDSPEEVNRIVTDHVSSIRFACSQSALDSLKKENLTEHSYLIGDPMYDAFLYYGSRKNTNCFTDVVDFNGKHIEVPDSYYYMTCHRQENTDDPKKLQEILSAMDTLDAPTIYPVHPRNQSTVKQFIEKKQFSNILFVQPVGYLSSISFAKNARKIVTDSGGVQREAFFAEKKCVTVLDFEVWPETMRDGRNVLAKPDRNEILEKLSMPQVIDPMYQPFGDGHAAEKMVSSINQYFR